MVDVSTVAVVVPSYWGWGTERPSETIRSVPNPLGRNRKKGKAGGEAGGTKSVGAAPAGWR